MTEYKKNISIKDVARVSGVSVTTVSRIINNTGRFSKTTQQKVFAVIDKLGYEKNKLAVSLRSNQSHTVGVLVPDITNNFYAAIVKKCEQLLFTAGYSSIICNTERSVTREEAYLQTLMEQRVDGLIIISSTTLNDNQTKLTHSIPTVYIDRDPHWKNELIISSAHYQGGRLATNFLIEKKLNPFLVMTKTKSSSTLERVRAFKDVLTENNIPNIEKRILILNLTSDKLLNQNSKLKQFMQHIHQTSRRPVGIFGINDNVAYMIIRAARTLKIKIPKQLSVIGFDGTSLSEISSPRITTVKQNTGLIAKSACKSLISLMSKSTEQKTGLIQLPVKLIVKESTI